MSSGFYARLRNVRNDDDELAACIERVVNQLQQTSTTDDRPGMLLGKIQSGKTRAFVGVIARSFDKQFDIAVVLTKGTKTLSAQTVARLTTDFNQFIEDDECLVFDIMQPPGRLTKSEQRRKLVIVAKKQADNLRRLIQFFQTDYPESKHKTVLLIDDEADLASIRFIRRRGTNDIDQGTIAEQIDELRNMVARLAYLQVTATPYSLYLQPADYSEENYVYKPKKPAFTEILPIHSGYVGGDDYFIPHDVDNPRSFLFVPVTISEQDALRRPDLRRIREKMVLDSPNTIGLVRAIITFILAVCIRRWQQEDIGEKKKKYSMIIHNDTQTRAHDWQFQVIGWVLEAIMEAASGSEDQLKQLFDAAFADLSLSVQADKGKMPTAKQSFAMFIDALESEDIVMERVNKDNDVMALLDDKAELKLRTPFNIFVGGSILDRGITIPNLISFYYGRNPRTMQADTVLQHSRMYGNRDRRDLAVTRFFTSQDVFNRLYTINEFENTLREAFENRAHDQGVVFIQSDRQRRVRPCAPNKVLLSNVVAVRSSGIYLPSSFDTRSGTELKKALKKLQKLIPASVIDKKKFVEIEMSIAIEILTLVESTLDIPADDFEWSAMRGLFNYYAGVREPKEGKVLLAAETGRRLDRENSGDKSGLSILGAGAMRRLATDSFRQYPALILLQQSGTKELHWNGGQPFWWPILVAPTGSEPCVFATKVARQT